MEAIDLAARAGSAWDHLRLRRMQQRIDRVEEDRTRLRLENRMLADDLRRELTEQDRLVDVLEDAGITGYAVIRNVLGKGDKKVNSWDSLSRAADLHVTARPS